MNIKKVLVNAGVMAISAVIGLGACELLARITLNPADYLSVEMVQDEVLGAVPKNYAKAGRFDRWGFRNATVPETADIVAIGDSHTYGNTATMQDSWPYVLGGLTGQRVYNMGMGGYGPNQYYHVLTTKALTLKPRMVLCGLYMGDDFENAFQITYGLSHWAYLRQIHAGNVGFNIWEAPPEAASWHKKMRVWLSRHSVTYQLIFHGPLMGRIQGEAQIKNASRLYDSVASINIPEKHVLEAFLPKGMLLRLDQDNEAVREGMRVTFELLRSMNDACIRQHAQFLVVVIPTKEMVFSEYLEGNRSLPMNDVIDKLLKNERLARARTFEFLNASGIGYVDTLPTLKNSLEHQLYARTAADMHPNRNGYKMIAKAVFEAIRRGQSSVIAR